MEEEKFHITCEKCKTNFDLDFPKPIFISQLPEICGVVLNIKECIKECPGCGALWIPVLAGFQGMNFNAGMLTEDPRKPKSTIIPATTMMNPNRFRRN